MKVIYKTIVSCILCFLMLFMTAFAVQDNMTLSTNLKVSVNDDNVNTVPITYQGRAYLNIRDIAPYLNLKVDYDKNTNTINLSGISDTAALDDTTIMTINNTNIQLGHFNAVAKWNRFYAGMSNIPQKQYDNFRDFIRDQIIEEEAVKKLAADNNIEMTSDDYDAVHKQIQDFSKKFQDKDDFITYLYNDIGISYLNYTLIQEYQHLREKVRDQLVGQNISTSDMQEYYSEHQSVFETDNAIVKHILFKTTDDDGNILPYTDKKKVEQKALMVLNDINNQSITFEDAMKKYTEDSSYSSYPNGFDVQKGSVQPEFWQAVSQMQAGDISTTLVETKYGYHIIEVISKSSILPFDEVKDQISEYMKNDAFNAILKNVTDKFNITYNKDIYNSFVIY